MKLKNITNEIFSFEGITIQPQGESNDISSEQGQRLLALYYGRVLMPCDQDIFKNEKTILNEKAMVADGEKDKKETEDKAVDPVPVTEVQEFKCPNHPDKVFASKAALGAHMRFSDKPKEDKQK